MYFPCLAGFRVCTWEGKVKGMCGRLEQDGWECGGVRTASLKDLACCSHLQAPPISAPVSDSYYADVTNSPVATSLTCGQLEIDTGNVALPSAVRPKAGDGSPTGAAVSLPLLTVCFRAVLAFFTYSSATHVCWGGLEARVSLQVSGVGWGWRVRSIKVALGLAVNFFSFHWYF